ARRSFTLLAEHWFAGDPSSGSGTGTAAGTADRGVTAVAAPALATTRRPSARRPPQRRTPMTTPPLQTATDAAAKVADGALLVDVRSAQGRAAHGEIPGATLVDRDDLDALFGPADAPAISLDTPVVVVCGSPN